MGDVLYDLRNLCTVLYIVCTCFCTVLYIIVCTPCVPVYCTVHHRTVQSRHFGHFGHFGLKPNYFIIKLCDTVLQILLFVVPNFAFFLCFFVQFVRFFGVRVVKISLFLQCKVEHPPCRESPMERSKNRSRYGSLHDLSV